MERTDHNLVVPSENDLLLEIGDDDADAGADADSECADCKEAIDHKSRVLNNINRQEYRRDRNENGHRSYAVDMQKVLLLPKLATKQHHFVSRLVFFIETFASLKTSSPDADHY